MDEKIKKIKHLLTIRGTWVIIISQTLVIIQTLGLLDDTAIEQFKSITTSFLEIATILGILHVYETEPKKPGD